MADYLCTITFLDDRNGITDKTFEGTFADNAAAVTARASLVNALEAATGVAVIKSALTEVTEYANSPTAGYRVTDRMSATVYLSQASNKRANFQIPGPISTIMSGNSLITTQALWTAVIDEVESGGAGWTISDGETVDDTGGNGTISGKLISVRSGVRTLPS